MSQTFVINAEHAYTLKMLLYQAMIYRDGPYPCKHGCGNILYRDDEGHVIKEWNNYNCDCEIERGEDGK